MKYSVHHMFYEDPLLMVIIGIVTLAVGGIAKYISWEISMTRWRRSALLEPLNEYAGRFLPESSDEGWTVSGTMATHGKINVCWYQIKISGNVVQLDDRERYKLNRFVEDIQKACVSREHMRALAALDGTDDVETKELT